MTWRLHSANPFKARFDGLEIFDALALAEGGLNELDAIALWEVETARAYNLSLEDWSGLSIETRSLYVCGLKLPQWQSALEADKAIKEARRKHG